MELKMESMKYTYSVDVRSNSYTISVCHVKKNINVRHSIEPKRVGTRKENKGSKILQS